jgi:broad specificity phosphatase PhoE
VKVAIPQETCPARQWCSIPASRRVSGEVAGGRQASRSVLVVHAGTLRATLAIALDLSPDAALRFVIDSLSLTRIDHLDGGWRVVAVNQR